MDESLDMLEETPEVLTDEMLAVLVRLQRLNDEAQDLLIKDAMAEGSTTPTYIFRKGLRERLNKIRQNARPELTANGRSIMESSLEFCNQFSNAW